MIGGRISRWVWSGLAAGAFLFAGCGGTEGASRVAGAIASELTLSSHQALAEGSTAALPDRVCPLGEAKVETTGRFKGKRRLALVVGVGDYLASNVPKLAGPDKDAEKVYGLLTDASGFGFPKENVCLLKNHAATRAAFKEAFRKALVGRAHDGDVVVIYFAGHGSQSIDGNGDEEDNLDETLMMVDARNNGEIDVVDDEFNYLLSGLFTKMSGSAKATPQNVTVLLDSCNSGTAARGIDGPLKARYFQAPKETLDSKAGLPAPASSTQRWDGDDLPGLVFVSAAIDGTAANEINGEGLFTKAMIQTLRESAGKPLTYSQMVLRIRQLIPSFSSMVNQKVDAQGGTFVDREVFGDSSVARPPSYEVKEVKGDQVTLVGTAQPGWSAGATVRVFAWPPGENSAIRSAGDLQDPSRAKATCIVDSVTGLGAKAHVLDAPGNSPILPGDLAVLAIAGKESVTLTVRFLPSDKAGGVPEARKQAVLEAIKANEVYRETIRVATAKDKSAAWTLGAASNGQLQLFDPAGALRSAYDPSAPALEGKLVADNLHQQARQQALMQLKGEPGDDFVNDQTVQVWAEEAPPQDDLGAAAQICPRQNSGYWDKEKNGPGTHALEIPLCQNWVLKAKLSEAAPTSLYVGGLILSGDGGIIGFPGGLEDEPGYVLLKPGQEYTFKRPLLSAPPINGLDHILVFGTRESNKVEWSRLSAPASTRAAGASDLQNSLEQYLNGGGRGVIALQASSKPATWTSTHLTLKVVANSLIAAPADASGKKTREYTVQKYDIREQLPSNQDSALYKLLMKTWELTNLYADNADGPRYNQDTEGRWDKLSDQENLAKGIDCSRSIWFAFTRSGLQYNKAGGAKNPKQPEFWSRGAYVSTAEMVDPQSLRLDQVALNGEVKASPLRNQFQSCRAETRLRPGDVLVYRRLKGQSRADGHVVMIIDPDKNIAWGSHAWDGSAPKGSAKVDTGVEYQWIKSIKKGMDDKWEAWDTSNMVLVDCWRHKQIAAEWAQSPVNRSGSYDMSIPLAQASPTPASPTPAASTPAASTPASSTPAASTPASSTPAASTPASSTPAASPPASSTPAASKTAK